MYMFSVESLTQCEAGMVSYSSVQLVALRINWVTIFPLNIKLSFRLGLRPKFDLKPN